MRFNVLLSILILSMFTLAVGNLLAAETNCSQIEAMTAFNETGSLKSWQDIYDSYKRYNKCDDGAIAEGYSDSITTLLANNWRSLKGLSRLAEIDKDFLRFVLGHIDATADFNDVQKVYKNAIQKCPKDSSKLCSLIKKASKNALKEFKE
jgi:hypothetical protein